VQDEDWSGVDGTICSGNPNFSVAARCLIHSPPLDLLGRDDALRRLTETALVVAPVKLGWVADQCFESRRESLGHWTDWIVVPGFKPPDVYGASVGNGVPVHVG